MKTGKKEQSGVWMMSGIVPRKKRIDFPLSVSLLLALALIITVSGNARAESANILPQDIHVETRTGVSAGSRLCWDWQSTQVVQFTVVRSGETAAPLYEKTSSSDAGEFVVQIDDTYLLLWRNSGNESVALEFTVTVEPGFGSLPLLLLVVAVMVFVLIFMLFFMMRGRRTGGKAETGESKSPLEKDVQSGGGYETVTQPPVPLETSPITRGSRYCPSCGNPVPRVDAFCKNCGSRLGP